MLGEVVMLFVEEDKKRFAFLESQIAPRLALVKEREGQATPRVVC